MTVLLLIRHGHTDAAGKVLTGLRPGVPLNERGRREAHELVERLAGIPLEAIYSSPLERARQTVGPLARERNLPVRVRRGLQEVDYGRWSGRSISSLRRTALWRTVQQLPSAARFPDGESLLEVQARALAELELIADAHPRGTVAIASHADPIRLVVAHFAGMHPDLFQRLSIDPASVSVVGQFGGAVRLVKVNDTGGLDALRPPRRTRGKLRG